MTRARDLAKLISGSSTLGGTGELVLKDVDTADGSSPKITFQTGDTDIAADDVLGTIDFQAPDEGTGTDALLVAAGIEAVSEGDFSASSNATKLSFKTGASETATEKMTIKLDGKVGIGLTDPDPYFADNLVVSAPADGGVTIASTANTNNAYLMFADGTTGSEAYRGYIGYSHASPENMQVVSYGYTRFYTSSDGSTATERMRILPDGGITFNGDTAAANALDDYEEVTWSPVIRGAGTAGSYTTTTNYAKYIKLGNIVTVSAYLGNITQSSAGSNYLQVTGFPFNKQANHYIIGHAKVSHFNLPSGIIDAHLEGRGLYFGVNDGGTKDIEITLCRAFFVEWDDRSKKEQLHIYKEKHLPEPTFMVDTGGKSIHCYWVLKSPVMTEVWKPIQIRLVDYCKADKNIKDASR